MIKGSLAQEKIAFIQGVRAINAIEAGGLLSCTQDRLVGGTSFRLTFDLQQQSILSCIMTNLIRPAIAPLPQLNSS